VTDWLDDPDAVAAEYAAEAALRERVEAHRELLEGPDDEEVVRERLQELAPRRLLEVGCGLGELCEWAARNTAADVVAVDLSPRMAALAAHRGVHAIEADVRALPFADAAFDCVVANFVLYHVAEVDDALAELARVLERGGRLIATTTSDDTTDRRRAWAELMNEEPQPEPRRLSFSRENGGGLLIRHFRACEQIDCDADLVFRSRERLVAYVESLPPMRGLGPTLPELREPFRLPTNTTVFVATR
jgi:SAM-dependent methyltransferase